MIELSIIIVSYNTKNLLKDCLLSVYNSLNFANFETKSEIIVVDNASSDGTVGMLKRDFHRIRLIENLENVGFGTACNQGIRISKGKFILLLNSDTKLVKHTILNALREIKNKEDIGVLGVKLLNTDQTIQHSAGFFPNIFRILLWLFFIDDLPIIRNLIKPYHVTVTSFYNKSSFVDWVTGAFFLARREAIFSAGLFDEKMFMYVEEIDLCYRIKKANWQIIYSPCTLVIHQKGGSSKSKFAGIMEEFNGIEYFCQKYHGDLAAKLIKVSLKVGALLRVLIFAIIRHDEERKKPYLQYLNLVR